MKFCLISTLVFLLLSYTVARSYHDCTECSELESSGHPWSYSGGDGPSYWSESYLECGGSHQSPINIDTTNAVGNYSWSSFSFQGYDVLPTDMTISNNGHTVQVSGKMRTPAILSGGGLGSEYTFKQLHFHWGKHDRVGSEHIVDGNSYPIEVHLVHYKTSSGKADLKEDDGLAVLGILFEIVSSNNPKLDSIIEGLESVEIAHSEASIIPFALSDLLPENTDDFYRYKGSLTTPPCKETVVWTVFKEPVTISKKQLKKFRHLYYDDGLKMADNFRPEQPLNDRTVYHAMLN